MLNQGRMGMFIAGITIYIRRHSSILFPLFLVTRPSSSQDHPHHVWRIGLVQYPRRALQITLRRWLGVLPISQFHRLSPNDNCRPFDGAIAMI